MIQAFVPTKRPTPFILALCIAMSAAACTMDVEAEEEIFEGEEDPTAEFEGLDDEWLDEGPLPEDEFSDRGDSTDYDISLAAAPQFQLPFLCNELWSGQTRSNHSPVRSVDFNRSNDDGAVVVAAAAGKVTRVANEGSRSYGRWIEISHGNGFTTRYAHLRRQDVSVGQSVNKGTRIGLVGNTGGSSGAHLHYEQRYNGNAVQAQFNGSYVVYYGTRNYRSNNCVSVSGGGGGGASGGTGRVKTSGAALTLRSGASSSTSALGYLANGAYVTISCQKRGQTVSGTYGTSNLWNKVGNGYIADVYTYTSSDGQVAPTCN